MASPAESAATEEAAASVHDDGAAAAEVEFEEEHGEGSENFQGPHKWRQHLRHVKAPKCDNSDISSDTDDPENIADR